MSMLPTMPAVSSCPCMTTCAHFHSCHALHACHGVYSQQGQGSRTMAPAQAVPVQSASPTRGIFSAAPKETPIVFPPLDTGIKHTYASYVDEPMSDLMRDSNNAWTLCVSVPIPSDLVNPTLSGLDYIVKYATLNDMGNSTIQIDTLITTTSCPVGIIPKSAAQTVYRNESGFGPRVVDSNLSILLSSISDIKYNDGSPQWNHYIDQQRLSPNVRITAPSNLYLYFHVFEYISALSPRSIAVEVDATWLEDIEEKKKREQNQHLTIQAEAEAESIRAREEERKNAEEEERLATEAKVKLEKDLTDQKARDEEQRLMREAGQKKAREDQERLEREEQEKLAEEENQRQAQIELKRQEEDARAAEERRKEEEERIAKETAQEEEKQRLAREEAQKHDMLELERKAREGETGLHPTHSRQSLIKSLSDKFPHRKSKKEKEELKRKAVEVIKHAPPEADEHIQDVIKALSDELPINQRCQNGYEWMRDDQSGGYRCKGSRGTGGMHFFTYDEMQAMIVKLDK